MKITEIIYESLQIYENNTKPSILIKWPYFGYILIRRICRILNVSYICQRPLQRNTYNCCKCHLHGPRLCSRLQGFLCIGFRGLPRLAQTGPILFGPQVCSDWSLNPIFRPRVPKPYFPVPGPFKAGRGRV